MSTSPQNCAEKAVRRVPRGEKRREEIAAIAERVFLHRGFTETTMQIIAEEAAFNDQKMRTHVNEAVSMFLARYGVCSAKHS